MGYQCCNIVKFYKKYYNTHSIQNALLRLHIIMLRVISHVHTQRCRFKRMYNNQNKVVKKKTIQLIQKREEKLEQLIQQVENNRDGQHKKTHINNCQNTLVKS